MKQRFFLFLSVFALLVVVLVFSGTGSQAVAQQRPPGGDSIPVQPPSPDPGDKEPDVKVVCSYNRINLCGVQCSKCGRRYYDKDVINGYATSYNGKCGTCNGRIFRPVNTNI